MNAAGTSGCARLNDPHKFPNNRPKSQWIPLPVASTHFPFLETLSMPLSYSTLSRLASRFAKKRLFDVSDSMAIAAIEKLLKHNLAVPTVVYASCLRDLAI